MLPRYIEVHGAIELPADSISITGAHMKAYGMESDSPLHINQKLTNKTIPRMNPKAPGL